MSDLKGNDSDFYSKYLLEESIEELYEEAPCGYLSTLPDGTIFKLNNTICKWLGYAKEELVGKKKFQQLLPIGNQIFYETHHLPLLIMQGFVKELNYEFLTKGGKRLPMLVNVSVKKDSGGKILFHRITVLDFSDRKKYEQELIFQKKKAEAATEAKEAFLSTVTHEIRTPIHAIIGVSDLLLKQNPRSNQLELLDALQFSANNLLHLVNDLLDLSKLNAGLDTLLEKPFSLKQLVQNIVNSFRPAAAKKDLIISLSLPDDSPQYFTGDPLKIGRIITNLLSNAIKFTEKGEVSLHIDSQQPREGKSQITFKVTDTGTGIPSDKLETIFQAFTQANETIHYDYGGTGLGLTICQQLLAMYGSHLEVESEMGKGSTFRFKLLLKVSEMSSGKEETVEESTLPLSGIKLLLVEDNVPNLLIASHYFKLWQLEFDSAPNGQVAVEMVDNDEYDLVLMDLNMPVMDGYEAARRIRQLPNKKNSQVPIVAFSASPRELVAEKLNLVGIGSLISKPFQASELYRVIKMHKAVTTTTAVQPAEIQLDLVEITEIFEGDKKALSEFFVAVVEDLGEVSEDFMKAAANKNLQAFRDAVHKTQSFLRIFQPTVFQTILEKSRKIYEEEEWEKLPDANREIIETINRMLVFLKRQI